MEPGRKSPLATLLQGIAILAGLVVGARLYIVLLPHSPALGAFLVIGVGAMLAFAVLRAERHIEELKAQRHAETPPRV